MRPAAWFFVPRLCATGLLAALGCAKPQEPTTPGAVPEATPEAKTCAALASAGPLATRMASVFPVQLGGAIFVLGVPDARAVSRVFEDLQLRETEVVACGHEVVAWVQAIDATNAANLDAMLRAAVPAITTSQGAVVPPQRAPRQQRSRD